MKNQLHAADHWQLFEINWLPLTCLKTFRSSFLTNGIWFTDEKSMPLEAEVRVM